MCSTLTEPLCSLCLIFLFRNFILHWPRSPHQSLFSRFPQDFVWGGLSYLTKLKSFDFQCKLRRVIRYLRLKDQKCKTVKPTSPDEEDVVDSLGKNKWKSFDYFLLLIWVLFRGSNFFFQISKKKIFFGEVFCENFEYIVTEYSFFILINLQRCINNPSIKLKFWNQLN